MSEVSYWENNVSKKTKQGILNAIGPLNLANQQKIHSNLTAFGLQDRILASVKACKDRRDRRLAAEAATL